MTGPVTGPVTALQRFDHWWRAPAPAERLGWVRVAVGLFTLAHLSARVPSYWRITELGSERFVPVGPLQLLDHPLPAGLVIALVAAAFVGTLVFTAGWRHRIAAPAFALLWLIVINYRHCWGHMSHEDHLVTIHVIVLALTPSADACSLDARAGRTTAREGERYGWPLRLLMLTTVISYMLAGWAKVEIGGWPWLRGESVRNQVAIDTLRKTLIGAPTSSFARFAIDRPGLFATMAVTTVVVELGAFVAMFDRPRLRAAWVLAAIAMHLGIAAAMWILFPYPVFGVAFASFFPLERWAAWVRACARRRAG